MVSLSRAAVHIGQWDLGAVGWTDSSPRCYKSFLHKEIVFLSVFPVHSSISGWLFETVKAHGFFFCLRWVCWEFEVPGLALHDLRNLESQDMGDL